MCFRKTKSCNFGEQKRKNTHTQLGRENKPKPWQHRNLQRYNKKKQKYIKDTRRFSA